MQKKLHTRNACTGLKIMFIAIPFLPSLVVPKSSLVVTKCHMKKAWGKCGATCVLIFGSDVVSCQIHTPTALTARKEPWYPLDKMLGGSLI